MIAATEKVETEETSTSYCASNKIEIKISATEKVETEETSTVYRTKYKLEEMIEKGVVVYSQSWWNDYVLVLKNNHILLSCWMCHPKSRFSRFERFWVLVICSAFTFGYAGVQNQQAYPVFMLNVIVIPPLYDIVAKYTAKCGCVYEQKASVIACFKKAGNIWLIIQTNIAIIIIIWGMFAIRLCEQRLWVPPDCDTKEAEAPDLVPVMLASDWLELVRTRTGTRTGGFTLTVFNRSITSTRPGA